jgi:type VI protein secretion system component Hcp
MKRSVLTVLAAAVLGASSPAGANLFLKIDSIEGTSSRPHRKDWIDISGFGIGVRTPVTTDELGRPVFGMPDLTPLRVEAPSSLASPEIFAGAVTFEPYATVELEVETFHSEAGALNLGYWLFEDVRIISFKTTATTSDESTTIVTEEYELLPFRKVTYGFISYSQAGIPTGEAEFVWDLMTGEASTAITGTVNNFQFLTGDVDIDDLAYFPVVANPSEPLVGDYNQDGAVDAADYVVWRKNGGTAPQYEDWRGNFGAKAGGNASNANSATVPEPASVLLVAAGLFLWMLRRHC